VQPVLVSAPEVVGARGRSSHGVAHTGQPRHSSSVMVAEGARRATVGRGAELETIHALVASLSDGPRALFLRGPPGIGKTQLWAEGIGLARRQELRVLTTRPAGADARIAFAGLRDLVGVAADEVLPELPAPQRRALAVALALEEPDAVGPDPGVLSASFVATLRLLARPQPLLLGVDDAQWLDASSRAVLAFALRRLEDEHVGLLATVRAEGYVEVDDLLGAFPDALTDRCELAPLTIAALYELVHDRFGLSLARPTLVRLHELSGGNPFFALELARSQAEDDELRVPHELSELLRTRLSALGDSTRAVLLAAAALAQPTRQRLERVFGDVDEALEEAIAAAIIDAGSNPIRFTHPLLASVLYESATTSTRRTVHESLAEANLDAEERARHLALAAAGPSEKVAQELDRAVEIASGRGATASAAELAELALALTPAGGANAHRRSLQAAKLRFSSGDIARAQAMLEEALESATDDHQRAEIFRKLAELAYESDQVASLELFRLVLEHAGDDDRLRVDALYWLASGSFAARVSSEEGLALAEEAIRVAERTTDALTLALALMALAVARYFVNGEILTEVSERAAALAESVGDDDAAARAALEHAFVLLDSWELDRARETLERTIARQRAREDSEVSGQLEALAFVELGAGNLDRAAVLAEEAVAVAAQGGRVNSEMVALFRLGWVEALRGDLERARSYCARSLRLAEQGSGSVRGARLTLGYLESALENYESAWSYLDPANPLTGSMPPGRPVVHVPESVEVLVALGRTGEARELLEPFEERANALNRVWAIAATAHCRSLILGAEGDLEGAEEAAIQAIAITEANGWPLQLGRALLARGTEQRRGRRKGEARATLERAVAVFEEMGAKVWLERARHELRRIGGRSAPAGHGLSETETRIAELVAAGKTNNEVAQTLHLSRKTVEWNLSKIYRKLEVRSRTELAARFPEH